MLDQAKIFFWKVSYLPVDLSLLGCAEQSGGVDQGLEAEPG